MTDFDPSAQRDAEAKSIATDRSLDMADRVAKISIDLHKMKGELADNSALTVAAVERIDTLTTKVNSMDLTSLEAIRRDTAGLVEMWSDAGIFFKWMRRGGALFVWLAKVTGAIGAFYAAIHFWGPK